MPAGGDHRGTPPPPDPEHAEPPREPVAAGGRPSFVQGAFILAGAGLVSRMIGAVYRFPLPRLIGTDGLGLFQMAYPWYTFLLNLSTVGINLAISKLMAERLAQGDTAGAHRVFRVSLVLMVGLGVGFAVMLALAAPWIAALMSPRAYWSILATSPALAIVAVMAALRGYFQGYQNMVPTAASQVLEQMVRVATLFVFAWLLLPLGTEFAAAGATFGATTGALAGLALLLWFFRRDRRRSDHRAAAAVASGAPAPGDTNAAIARQILAFALPIAVAGIAVNIFTLVDAVIVPNRLRAVGFALADVERMFGRLTGMALVLINLPTVITYGLQLSLVPAISEALAAKNRALVAHRAATGIRLNAALAVPAVVGLYLLATPISALVFGDPLAGPVVAAMAGGVLFLTLQQTSSGILQGMGRTDLPAKNLLVGAAVKFLATWFLVTRPGIDIRGAAWATVLGFLVASSLNLTSMRRLTGVGLEWREALLRPGLAAAAMGVVVQGVWLAAGRALGFGGLATLLAVAAGVAAYGVFLVRFGGLSEADLMLFPRVGPIAVRLFRRARLLPGTMTPVAVAPGEGAGAGEDTGEGDASGDGGEPGADAKGSDGRER